jgi:hypothetical protein
MPTGLKVVVVLNFIAVAAISYLIYGMAPRSDAPTAAAGSSVPMRLEPIILAAHGVRSPALAAGKTPSRGRSQIDPVPPHWTIGTDGIVRFIDRDPR